MNVIQKAVRKLDTFQRSHRWSAFTFAVIKKYGEDENGTKAALLTYYGFLSLFPLLLLLATLANGLLGYHSHLRSTILSDLTTYFPLLGSQLSSHVHGLHRNGVALIVGVLFTAYGARGVAEAFRKGVQGVWHVPVFKRDKFPQSLLKSLCLLTVGALGFVTAAVLAGVANSAGHGWVFRTLSIAVNLFILFWTFNFLLDFSLPRRLPRKDTRPGALAAAIGLVGLQYLGGYVLAHELRNLDALYSYFALALGLLFWIYLQTQILYYSMEIAYVKSNGLWPRSLDGSSPTEVDKRLSAPPRPRHG